MVNRRRFIAGLGSLAVGSGALMQSGAFSTVKGERSVSVQTAPDGNALLGLEGVGDPDTTPTFENNSTGSMDVTLESTDSSVEFDVGDTGSFTDTAEFGLNPGDDKEVAITGSSNPVPVSVTAKLPNRSNPEATISLNRTYAVDQPDQADQVQLTENGNTGANGNSGKYNFELENNGSIDVTIVGIGINETSNANAATVSGGDILAVGGRSVLRKQIPIDSNTPDQNTRRNLDPDVSLSTTGAAKTFTFDKFQAENGKVGMKNESVSVTLFFDDDTQTTLPI